MAHHSATKKAIRRTKTVTTRNIQRRSRIRSAIKNVRLAIESKDKKTASEALIRAQKELFRGVTKGVVRKHTASRAFSRLNAKVKALVA